MRVPINSASIREVLLTHDPLAEWTGAGTEPERYSDAAELAAETLRNMLGVAHIQVAVADAIDRDHAGFYRTVRRDDAELRRRIGLVARELWERHGNIYPRSPTVRPALPGPPPKPASGRVMIARPDLLEGWLREMEERLDAEGVLPVQERQTAGAMRSELVGLVDAYFEGSDRERDDARLAFSRFPRCCHQLSAFAGSQYAGLLRPGAARALLRGLVAESLLDMNLDWRDELLHIQALKRRAENQKLPYPEVLEQAAARSSAETADFLRSA